MSNERIDQLIQNEENRAIRHMKYSINTLRELADELEREVSRENVCILEKTTTFVTKLGWAQGNIASKIAAAMTSQIDINLLEKEKTNG